jgi:hypothetical protein
MTVLVQDLFAGTNGTDIDVHAPDIDVVGSGWLDSGANQVQLDGSGALKFSGVNRNCVIDTGATDQIVTVNFNAGGSDNRATVALRAIGILNSGTQTHYNFNFRTNDTVNTLQILSIVSGSGTVIASSGNLALSNSTTYEIKCRAVGSSLEFYIDGALELSVTDTSITSGDYAGLEHQKYVNGNARFNDFKAEDNSGTAITVTATLGAIDYASQNTSVDISGSIDVTATLGAITYSSQDATVDISGSVDVVATLGAISYASNGTVVGVTGNIDVSATLGQIQYASQNTVVSIGGVVSVVSTLGTINYASNAVSVGLTGAVDVQATLGAISYSSNDTVVSLAGLVDINATLGVISYNSSNTVVSLGAGQIIGNVTSSFKADEISSSFKPNQITVTFKV